jgi:hypothetical protein
MLTCLGRHTISGLLCNLGQQFEDWSAAYRLFEKARFAPEHLWRAIQEVAVQATPDNMPILTSVDDTLVRKSGIRVPGAAWRRDPLGPKFVPNLVWAQRFVQACLIVPAAGWRSAGRAIPIDLVHSPTPKKPPRNATPDQQQEYARLQKAMRLTQVGRQQIARIRERLDDDPATRDRVLVVAVDGGYTTEAVFRNIPPGTTMIGRIRADASLHQPPSPMQGPGRPRRYGLKLPTPEQIRKNDTLPWQSVQVYAVGRVRSFQIKRVQPVRWKPAGPQDMSLLVVRALAPHDDKSVPRAYRNPAYLLCSDPSMPPEQLLQSYVWRWEEEVVWRDEKTLIGMGEAQMHNPAAASLTPVFAAVSYALLHLAALRCGPAGTGLPLPKWRARSPRSRASTSQLISRLRAELWGRSLGMNIDGFARDRAPKPTVGNPMPQIEHAVLYAAR